MTTLGSTVRLRVDKTYLRMMHDLVTRCLNVAKNVYLTLLKPLKGSITCVKKHCERSFELKVSLTYSMDILPQPPFVYLELNHQVMPRC